MRSSLSNLINLFFRETPAKTVGMFRIGLGIMLFLNLLLYLPYTSQFYLDSGYLPVNQAIENIRQYQFSLFYFLTNPWFVYGAIILAIIASLFFIFGMWSRFFIIIIFIVFLSMFWRYPVPNYGGTGVLLITTFYTLFLETDKAYVPTWYARRYGIKESVRSWPVRLILIQLVIVYFFSGIIKVRSDDWFNGQAMLWILNNSNFAFFNFQWLKDYPILINILTYTVLAIELIFPYLVWFPQTRLLTLAGIALLHIGIMLSINVTYFSEIMLVCLILFLNRQQIEVIEKSFRGFGESVRAQTKALGRK